MLCYVQALGVCVMHQHLPSDPALFSALFSFCGILVSCVVFLSLYRLIAGWSQCRSCSWPVIGDSWRTGLMATSESWQREMQPPVLWVGQDGCRERCVGKEYQHLGSPGRLTGCGHTAYKGDAALRKNCTFGPLGGVLNQEQVAQRYHGISILDYSAPASPGCVWGGLEPPEVQADPLHCCLKYRQCSPWHHFLFPLFFFPLRAFLPQNLSLEIKSLIIFPTHKPLTWWCFPRE